MNYWKDVSKRIKKSLINIVSIIGVFIWIFLPLIIAVTIIAVFGLLLSDIGLLFGGIFAITMLIIYGFKQDYDLYKMRKKVVKR